MWSPGGTCEAATLWPAPPCRAVRCRFVADGIGCGRPTHLGAGRCFEHGGRPQRDVVPHADAALGGALEAMLDRALARWTARR
jgi:hypothetical protein